MLLKLKTSSIQILVSHFLYEHDKLPCTFCGEMVGKRNMRRHIGQKHTEHANRKYQCSLCGKGFLEPRRLQDHMNTHTGAKPYMCNYCGAAFASQGTWRMHERTVHLGHKRDEHSIQQHLKVEKMEES